MVPLESHLILLVPEDGVRVDMGRADPLEFSLEVRIFILEPWLAATLLELSILQIESFQRLLPLLLQGISRLSLVLIVNIRTLLVVVHVARLGKGVGIGVGAALVDLFNAVRRNSPR